MLTGVPATPFTVSVNTWRPRAVARCPPAPQWVTDLVVGGASLSFEDVLMQAGRHFADALNPDVIPGSGTRRVKAQALAWYLIAMMNPDTQTGRLVLEPPGDPDIQRIAMEILGVGFGIELLRSQGQIDARTLRKSAATFDFEANAPGGTGRIAIEVKGTLDGASIGEQQKSFRGKLRSAGLLAGTRGYDRAIGIIFLGWTGGANRGDDCQLLDPEYGLTDARDEAIRESLRFYARRYDEIVGMERAASFLWSLAAEPRSINEIADLSPWLARAQPIERHFSRSALTFEFPEVDRTFWGGFWDAKFFRPPFPVDGLPIAGYPIAYTGIDKRVIEYLRQRQFEEFLSFHTAPSGHRFSFVDRRDGDEDGPTIQGYVFADADGLVSAWLSQVPQYVSRITRE